LVVVQRDLLRQLVAEALLLREEELELEQVAEPHSFVPERGAPVVDVILAGPQQGDLRDGAGDEEVDDRVAIVGRGEVLVRADRVHRLGAFGVARDDAARHQRGQGALHARWRVEPDLDGRREGAPPDVLHQVLQRDHQLGRAERAISAAEQRHRDQRRRGDRRHAVDADGDLEGELLDREVLLLGVVARAVLRGERVRRPDGLRERDRPAEPDVDVAEAGLQTADDVDEPAEALRLLGGAGLLGGVAPARLDLGVGDRGRDQEDVLALAATVGVDDVGEEPEAWRQQLAGARAAALDVPLEGEALLDQVVDVVLKDELVDRIVLEGAPDEEHAAATHQRADREEVHVDPAGGVIRGVAVLVQSVLQDEMVEVRLVRRQEDHRIALSQVVDVLEIAAVVVQRLAVSARVEEVDQLRGEVDDVRAVGGGDLLEIALRVAQHRRLRPSELLCQARDAGTEGGTREEGGRGGVARGREGGPWGARPAPPPLRALQRQSGLPGDEDGETGRLPEIGAAGAPPALAQLRRGSGLSGDHLVARRMPGADGLSHASGVTRIAEEQELEEAPTRAATRGSRKPCDAQRGEHGVIVGGEAGFQPRVHRRGRAAAGGGDRNGLVRDARRDVMLLDPSPQDAELGTAGGVEQEDAPPAADLLALLSLRRGGHCPAGYYAECGPPW